MGETFYQELASHKYPPEVRMVLNELALHQARQVVIIEGIGKGTHDIGSDWRPTLGADLFVRAGSEFGAGAGLSPEQVELIPRPNLQQLVQKLQPELLALIAAG